MSSSSELTSFDSSSVVSTVTDSSSQEASATTTSSNSATTSAGSGCVTCTGDVACPVCADDEYCVLTLLTCSECPRTYCAKKSSSTLQSNSSSTTSGSSSHSSAKVGGIVGGVVGGVAALAIALLLYLYLKYWSNGKRRTRNLLVAHEEYGDTSDVDPSATPSDKLHTQGSQPMLEPRNRSSAATAVTKASNILPIAYIPGVTAGKRGLAKPHPPLPKHLLRSGDTRSHITLGSSILGDDDDDDDDEGGSSATGAAAAAARNISSTSTPSLSEKQSPVGADDALTTAIRARPRLVQISEEEDGAEDDDESPVEKEEPSEKERTVTTLHLHTSDDDEHSLTLGSYPATEPQPSVRATQGNSDAAGNERDLQISSDADDDGDNEDDDDDDDDGSFILDVEVPESLRHLANNSHPPANEGSGSPFEDRFYI